MGVGREAIIFTLAFFLVMLSLKVVIGETDSWGPYYYRHAEKTYETGTTFYQDELSYLGRDFTYPPAYFMLAAQATRLFLAPSAEAVRVPLHLLVMAFSLFTTYLLFEKMEKRSRILAALIMTVYTFYFITNITITLHVLSFGMLNCAVILFRREKRVHFALGAMALAIAFSAHPLSIFAFPVYAYATGGFSLDIRKAFLFGAAAVLLSLPIYLPIFLKSGLPNEIVPTEWGYAHSFGFDGLYFDMIFLLPMALLAIVFGFMRKRFVDSALLLVLFLATAYVSFRVNLLLGVFLACFFPRVFEKESRDGATYALFMLAVLLNLAVLPLVYYGVTDWCSWGAANRMCISPMEYIEKYTPGQSKVASDPEFGHLETYYGKRPVLADLYVEYADIEKYSAEAIFFYELNSTPLEKYGIDVMLLDDKWGKVRDIGGADRVYDNGYVHIFRRPPE